MTGHDMTQTPAMTDWSSPWRFRALALAIPLGALLAAPILAEAAPAVTGRPVNLRAGPDADYPLVGWLPEGTQVDVQGCLPDYRWCDVVVGYERGWVHGRYLNYYYQNRYAPIIGWGGAIGIPLVGFSIGSYWDDYYRQRPWYRERPRWEHRHYPVPPAWQGPSRAPDYRPPAPRLPVERPPGTPVPDYRPPVRQPVMPAPARPPERYPQRDYPQRDYPQREMPQRQMPQRQSPQMQAPPMPAPQRSPQMQAPQMQVPQMQPPQRPSAQPPAPQMNAPSRPAAAPRPASPQNGSSDRPPGVLR